MQRVNNDLHKKLLSRLNSTTMSSQLRALIQNEIAAKKLRYKPNAVIVGQTGAGKTTLANKLCNVHHDAGVGRGSITQHLFRNNVSVGMNSFWLIDTPGTDSSTNTYKHAFLLRKALTATAINTIFVIIKFENRFEKMVDIFYSQPVHLYGKRIVVMISHLDQSNDMKKDFKEICELFTEQCPDVSNIVFYSERGPIDQLANVMFSCISNMVATQIEISDEDFHLKFNTMEATFQIRQSFNEYRRKAAKIANDHTMYIYSDELEQHAEDKDEVLHMMLVEFKNELDDMFDVFVKEHGEKMTEMNYFTFSIKMQAENVKLCDEFTNAVIPLMSYNLFDNEDPRNLIKRCPSCGLIWYKTEGCDGATTCGSHGFENSTASPLRKFFKFVKTYINGRVSVKKKSIIKIIMTQTPTKGSVSSTYVGCYSSFVWRDLPQLDNELILSLYKVKTMDEAKALIKAERFHDVRRNYESGIDFSLHE